MITASVVTSSILVSTTVSLTILQTNSKSLGKLSLSTTDGFDLLIRILLHLLISNHLVLHECSVRGHLLLVL